MPTLRPTSRTPVQGRIQHRAVYARTVGDFLTAAGAGTDGVNPSEVPPIWWYGLDSGGGSHPIGPNGPFGNGMADAIPAVIRATALVVDPIAQSPLKAQELGFAGQPLVTPRWLTDPMLLRDDDRFTADVYPNVLKLGRTTFWAAFLRSSLHWGIGAFITQLDQTGQPLAGTLKLIDPLLLTTERDDAGVLHWVLGAEGAYEDRAVFDREGYLTLGPVTYRIVTLRNPHSNVDAEGYSMGVFEQSPGTFGIAQQISNYTSGTFRSGVPAGYLQVSQPANMTREQADELRARWLSHHGGDRRSIAVLNAHTSFQPLNLSPVDAALAEVKRLSIADVAHAFSISSEMLGVSLGGSLTYGNVRDYFRAHRDLSLGIWVAAFQDCLTALMAGTTGVKVDLDAFTRAEPGERYTAYTTAIDAGILTVDEVRAMEGLPALPPSATTPEEARSLSAAETSQKVYLAVANGILSVEEARQMIKDAGGDIVVEDVPTQSEPEPSSNEPSAAPVPEEQRHLKIQPWRGRT